MYIREQHELLAAGQRLLGGGVRHTGLNLLYCSMLQYIIL